MSRAGRLLRWGGRRLAALVAVAWAAATVSFLALELLPGDPVDALLGPNVGATPQLRETIREDLGLDQPLAVRYVAFLGRLAVLDLGRSYRLGRPVAELLAEKLPPTLELAAAATVVVAVIALAITVLGGAARPSGRRIVSGIALVGSSTPAFWVGLVLLGVFSFQLRLLPATGSGSPAALVLPAVTLGLPIGCVLGQVMLRSLEDAEARPFWATVRARGRSRTAAVVRHGLRHATIPAMTLAGWAVAGFVGGAVLIETVFARAGLGRALVDAVVTRDVPVITGIVLVSAIGFAVATTVVESLAPIVDPRLRGGRPGAHAPGATSRRTRSPERTAAVTG
ncbi:ABC transporter permease [Agromyces sp. MMS24-JH15]|uniref:ABC transporter permease n=1 Tax=Agromyces sp. MMS24-JH15 TaxID=3243765 RepID=UPI003748FC0A